MTTKGNGFESEIDRREFLRLTLMSSAMLIASGVSLEAAAETGSSLTKSYAALHPLAPGAVRPEGWLRVYLERQAAELGSQLPQVSWPFSGTYWTGEEEGESWWPWEQKAYWIDGATRLGLVLDDQKLIAQAEASIRYTLAHADADGYLGPQFFKEPTGDFHRWPQMLLFRGMAAGTDAGRNPEVVEALHKHYLNDKANYGKPTRNVTNIENMMWLYERTGDKRLLDLAEKSWAEYMKVTVPGGDGGDLSAMRVYAATPIDAHGVTYIETAKQPAILYMLTGNPEYLRYALAAQRRIFDHHMLIDGIPSTSEYYRTRTSLDSHETCDIADHTWSWGYMLMATGDGVWADRVERACMNAGFGAIKKDWKALQYFSCPNQFLATLNSDHNVMEHGGHMMAFQPNPGQHTACCGGDVHRVYPNYVIRMWMKDDRGGLSAVLYGPSRVKTTVGAQKQEVEIVQETDYPFDEHIHFTIKSGQPVEFPLSLRIPAWCSEPRILVNEKAVTMPQIHSGFATLERKFNSGDKITLVLPMKTALSHWPQNGIGVEHGPLVYSLAIKPDWKPAIVPKYSTADFPCWNAMPASEWNYALAIDADHVAEEVKLERKAMTKDPWVDPPVTLKVPAKTVAGWELQQNPDDAKQIFTPPLPDLETSKFSDATEQITLVPYGSTHLRLTIFPNAKSS